MENSKQLTDRLDRPVGYLRVSVTDLCNLRCQYCMPEEGVDKHAHPDNLTLEEIYQVVASAVDLGITKVRLTGGEPLVRRGVDQLLRRLGELEGITDLTFTTNAILLERFLPTVLEAGVKRINVSLDTLDPDKYKEITRGGNLQQALDGIAAARAAGLSPIKLNAVLIRGFNDNEITDLVDLTRQGVVDEVRFIELMPMGENYQWAEERYLPASYVKEVLELGEPTEFSGTAQIYTLPQGGRVGLIHPVSHEFCQSCNRLRLTADGKIKPCLLSDREVDVREILRQGGDPTLALKQAVAIKPASHHLQEEDGVPRRRDMGQIGG